MGLLSDKVAIVTEASKGIGAGIAAAMAAAGARVAVNYFSDKKGAERVVQAISDNRAKAIAVGPTYLGQQMGVAIRRGRFRVRKTGRSCEQRRGIPLWRFCGDY
jgi:NAD(P)-dependent dehydrogenase (short-subunit alcohol dehydrogenase family)